MAAPKMLKAGVVHRWEEYYSSEIQAVLDGKWNNTPVWGGANVHMIELADMAADAPKAVADDIKAVMKKSYDDIMSALPEKYQGYVENKDQ